MDQWEEKFFELLDEHLQSDDFNRIAELKKFFKLGIEFGQSSVELVDLKDLHDQKSGENKTSN